MRLRYISAAVLYVQNIQATFVGGLRPQDDGNPRRMTVHAHHHHYGVHHKPGKQGLRWQGRLSRILVVGTLLIVGAQLFHAHHMSTSSTQQPLRVQARCVEGLNAAAEQQAFRARRCRYVGAAALPHCEGTVQLTDMTQQPMCTRRRKLHTVVEHKDYKAMIPELLNGSDPHYVAFTCGLREDGTPWCRDCVAALPLVR